MGKILNFLKKYAFGAYRSGLYSNGVITFGSLLSVILSSLFLLGFLTVVSIYFNEIFIQRPDQIAKQETKSFAETELSQYSVPQALKIFPSVTLYVVIPLGQNTTCNNFSAGYLCNQKFSLSKFEDHGFLCSLNFYQNDQIIENCANATNESGFSNDMSFYQLQKVVSIYGLDQKMGIYVQYNSKAVLSNGQLLDQSFLSMIKVQKGSVKIYQSIIEYKKSTSNFEQLFSRQKTSYYPDLNSVDVAQSQTIFNKSPLDFYIYLNPAVQSFQVQPKQFYEIFPMIGALLGLLKLFSLVSIYNQYKFEKELEESLTQTYKQEKDEEDNMQHSLNSFNEHSLNKSNHLLESQAENEHPKLKHNELYSFNTFKELFLNVQLLMTNSKSKEKRLNQHQKQLNHLQSDAQRLENEMSQTLNTANDNLSTTIEKLDTANHKINGLFEQLQMREQEISELRNQQEHLINKNLNLERNNSELWSRIASLDLMFQEQNQEIKLIRSKIQEQGFIKHQFDKKND